LRLKYSIEDGSYRVRGLIKSEKNEKDTSCLGWDRSEPLSEQLRFKSFSMPFNLSREDIGDVDT
jgi:hypothetical protein